ncbi:MFS transporter [Streptantibioticus rubrisoli]|uniref:MFS transporter n=1 Tax=Streptantibioticus rubrisoli TaxID=1387313 RepID=UPI00361533B3
MSFGLSSFGNGAVLPLTAVYVSEQLGLGLPWAGRYFGAIALTSFVLTPLGGRLADLRRPGAAAATGVLLTASGYLLLAAADGWAVVLVCAALVGAGNALFYPALAPTIGAVTVESERQRAFSLRYTAMNVGAGLGAGAGALFVAGGHGVHGYRLLYVLDALTFVPLALTLLRTGQRRAAEGDLPPNAPPASRVPATPGAPAAPAPAASGYLAVLGSRAVLGMAAVQCGAMLFGYAQFESSVPLLVRRSAPGSLYLLSGIVVVNTVAVVVLQRLLVPRLRRWPQATALLLAPSCWVAAYCCGALSVLLSGTALAAALAVFAALFAAGETAYACSFYPLLMKAVPRHLLGRASAITSLASNVGSTAGPAVGVALLTHTSPGWTWSLLAASATATAAACLMVRSARLESAEAPAVARSVPDFQSPEGPR